MSTPPPAYDASEPTLDAVYELSAGPYKSGELRVLSFEGHEEMNGLFAFDVVFWAKDLDEAELPAALLGQPVALGMHVPGGARHLRGIAAGITVEAKHGGGRHAFRLQLVPRLWLLGKRVNSRIFQDKTVQEIVDVVLEEHGVARTWDLFAKYPPRQYCVQYQEDDLHFVMRLLAEEGIFFSFEHPEDDGSADPVPERLVLGDDTHAYAPIAGDPALVYRHQTGEGAMKAEENQVTDFRLRTRVEPSAVVMRDYDFQRPLLDLTSGAPPADAPLADIPTLPKALEVYEHHGEYEETDADAKNAGVVLEQLRAGVREAHGMSVCRRLAPGHKLDLHDHDIERLNATWLVTRVDHLGVSPEGGTKKGARVYENRFRCVPAEVVYRPPRPPRVTQQVIESAIVVGPEGQEIFTDSFGRVKVQFHWDREGKRNEHSSCWMRVMQAWAGAGWGFQFIPRIGMEVVVSFLGGDLDRPVVMGCLYNALSPPSHGLPTLAGRSGIRTQSTPGGGGSNEIAFDDRAGREQLFVHAQRDHDEQVGNDRTLKIGNDRREQIARDSASIVGRQRIEETEGDVSATIGGAHTTVVGGVQTLRIGGERRTEIGGAEMLRVADGLDVDVRGARDQKVGSSDTLLVKGDRTSVVHGEEMRVVWSKSRTILYNSATVNIAGGLTLSVGSPSEPSSAQGQISGDLSLKGGGALELAAGKGIQLRVGKTLVNIGPDEVSIESDKITLKAKSIEGKSDKTTMSMGEAVEIAGKTVKIYSDDKAILELDKEAKLDGQSVKIKPGLAAEQKKAEEREQQAKDLPKVKVHLFDRKGKVITNASYEVSFFGYHAEGTAADGTVEVPAFPDVDKAHVRWGRPKDQRENPKDTEQYEFEMDVYMVVEHADEEEALRRKLHNLGHQGDEVYEAVHKLQAVLGAERTGVAADVKAEAESRHDALKPVEVEEKGA